ncbi:hypothetical protein VNO77_44838 [Canavalia gladiata]|uniref:Uncharacterized protein n=1 Tax=Canavalia gladiata TaxID=3824 RepID=A0AAN9JXQ8_CANGL
MDQFSSFWSELCNLPCTDNTVSVSDSTHCRSQGKISEAICYTDVFFALTIPMGIGIVIGINNVNDESSPTPLIVECCIGRDLN